jgi:hypothetical protein
MKKINSRLMIIFEGFIISIFLFCFNYLLRQIQELYGFEMGGDVFFLIYACFYSFPLGYLLQLIFLPESKILYVKWATYFFMVCTIFLELRFLIVTIT